MPDGLTDEQRSFVNTYLGATSGVSAQASSAQLASLWSAAKDKVDDQLRTLSDRLRKAAHPEVQGVADEVEALLAPLRVQLMVALQNFDAAPADNKDKSAVQKAIASARAWLDKDARVRAIDKNPWKIPVTIAATLGEALDRLEGQLAKVAGKSA